MSKDTQIVVVGAGPIGLIKIWGMKRLNPDLKIVVLEKYPVYKRTHTLSFDWQGLEAVMKAAHAEDEPVLVELLEKLKADPHYRTNEIQQLFARLAIESGVEIRTSQEVKKESINDLIRNEFPNAKLISGTDGVRSVVSQSLFSENNTEKHELDFVLQFRFEIKGDKKPMPLNSTKLYQQMARMGMIANEDVGNNENGKTPVSLQLFISKQDYLTLQKFSAGAPLKPFGSGQDANLSQKLPAHIRSFVTTYMRNRIEANQAQSIDPASVLISVNETPVTHAKEIVKPIGSARAVLMGDAALGLSYRKGFKAGLTAVARFLSIMEPSIKDAFSDTDMMDELLTDYQTWFLRDFAPAKIREVEEFSFWKIRSGMKAMSVAHNLKSVSHETEHSDLGYELLDFFNHFTADPLLNALDEKWRPYPHREYDVVQLGELGHVPAKHHLKRIGKIFTDYVKPYKSTKQFLHNFKLPFIAINNLGVGLIKTVVGMYHLEKSTLADGLLTLLRGTLELITVPYVFILKPITRGFATLVHGGFKTIEENQGMQHIAQEAMTKLTSVEDTMLTQDHKTIYEMLAYCNDLHRKFEKSFNRGQRSDLAIEECSTYRNIRTTDKLDRTHLISYFSLFAKPESAQQETKPYQVTPSL